jgi:hypothetical protein
MSRVLIRRCGATTRPCVRADQTPVCARLRVASVANTRANAVRLAAARHLLEVFLRRPILIKPAGNVAGVRALRSARGAEPEPDQPRVP